MSISRRVERFLSHEYDAPRIRSMLGIMESPSRSTRRVLRNIPASVASLAIVATTIVGSAPAEDLGTAGGRVVFDSTAPGLAPGDTTTSWDIYIRDLAAGTTTVVTQSYDGSAADNMSLWPTMSANGRFVLFASGEENLVPGDTAYFDAFVRDLVTNTTERVSVGASGEQANGASASGYISADGRFVVFQSWATNLVVEGRQRAATTSSYGIRLTGTTELASVSSSEEQGNAISQNSAISDDGRYIAFASSASNLVGGRHQRR